MVRVPRLALCSMLLLCATGCRRIDVSSEQTALLETDRAWAHAAADGGDAEKILAFWTEDARVVMAGQPTVEGKTAIREMVTKSLSTPGFHLTWAPERAEVGASGDVGYTVGTNQLTMPGAGGTPTVIPGRYITVWRRDAGGRWRCVEDYSTPSPAQRP